MNKALEEYVNYKVVKYKLSVVERMLSAGFTLAEACGVVDFESAEGYEAAKRAIQDYETEEVEEGPLQKSECS